MVDEHHLSRVRACQAVGLPRSALYKPTTDRSAKDAPVIEAINVMLEKRPRWGFWKCFDRLRQDGHGWNHKRVYRVYCAMRLNLKRKVRRRVLTRERQPLLASSELNCVWALDFMRDTLYDGRPFRTLNVIDEGNREALRIECGTSIPSSRVVRVLEQLVEMFGRPEAIRLDNGPELTAEVFVDWAEKNGVKLLFIQPGKPNQKRVHRALQPQLPPGGARCLAVQRSQRGPDRCRRLADRLQRIPAARFPGQRAAGCVQTQGVQPGSLYFWTVYLTGELTKSSEHVRGTCVVA